MIIDDSSAKNSDIFALYFITVLRHSLCYHSMRCQDLVELIVHRRLTVAVHASTEKANDSRFTLKNVFVQVLETFDRATYFHIHVTLVL